MYIHVLSYHPRLTKVGESDKAGSSTVIVPAGGVNRGSDLPVHHCQLSGN